jgi:hypothetical protein
MGTLRSATDHTGMVVNGITLGEAARDVDEDEQPTGDYRWDDSRLPRGSINKAGVITVDETEMM